MAQVRIFVAILISGHAFAAGTDAGAQDSADVESRVSRQMRFLNMTETEMKAEGHRRADIEYAEGRAEIESYGMRMMESVNVDKESGLYIRALGCAITNREDVESNAYNERLRELVAEKGPPANAMGVKERFQRLQRLIENSPLWTWKGVPWTAPRERSERLTLGRLTIQTEVVRNPARDTAEELYRRAEQLGDNPQWIASLKQMKEDLDDIPETVARVRIMRGSNPVATVRVAEGQAIKAAFLADLDILALKFMPPTEEIIFIDTIHGRVMWRYPVWWRELMKMLQQPRPQKALPDIT